MIAAGALAAVLGALAVSIVTEETSAERGAATERSLVLRLESSTVSYDNRAAGRCTPVSEDVVDCDVRLDLDGGSVAIKGLIRRVGKSTIAVTRGTDDFAGAGGLATVDAAGERISVALRLVGHRKSSRRGASM